MLYNDRSPLENHHCAVGFVLMERCNWVESIFPDRAKRKQWRDFVVELVLSTDLGRHFGILADFRNKTANSEAFLDSLAAEGENGTAPATQKDDRMLLARMLVKCADVSNPSKKLDLYGKWLSLIMEEFWRQGDKEKELGLPISPFMDREAATAGSQVPPVPATISNGLTDFDTSLPPSSLSSNAYVVSSQIGFVNLIVGPLYDAMESFIPLPEISDGLRKTKELWQYHQTTINENKDKDAKA